LFVDVGAWVGPVTLWAVDLGASVVAVEPDPTAYAALVTNTFGMPVQRIPAALVASPGEVLLDPGYKQPYGSSTSRIADEGIPVRGINVAALVDLCHKPPALVKVDIEGGELPILPDLLAWRVPILVSWHDAGDLDGRKAWFGGYTCEAISGDGWTGYSELLAVPA
jgi:FkbM family methyltransferase